MHIARGVSLAREINSIDFTPHKGTEIKPLIARKSSVKGELGVLACFTCVGTAVTLYTSGDSKLTNFSSFK
jgi:hypothetical protein